MVLELRGSPKALSPTLKKSMAGITHLNLRGHMMAKKYSSEWSEKELEQHNNFLSKERKFLNLVKKCSTSKKINALIKDKEKFHGIVVSILVYGRHLDPIEEIQIRASADGYIAGMELLSVILKREENENQTKTDKAKKKPSSKN